MFKKFALTAMVVLGLAAMPNDLLAKEASSSVNGIAAVQSTTTYTGTMSVVMGSSSSSITHTTDATTNGSNINLYIAPFQVGNMPGTIEVDAQNVIADGVPRVYSDVVTFTMGGFPIYFSAEIAVSVYNATTLVYTIKVLEAEYEGAPFIAIVNFTGTAL